MSKSLNYRKEIDGLRAIAVLGVIIFHTSGDTDYQFWLSGGLVGVDIFFVISGYLISQILFEQKSSGSLSLRNFYIKRAKRIVPALLTVLVFSNLFAWLYFLPKDLIAFSHSSIASLLFYSNFWFFFEDSYTAQASALKPLLHTWSLSIEEQFYLLFPLVFIIYLSKKVITKIIFGAFLASLILTVVFSESRPDATFFLPHFRAWELLLGTIALITRERTYSITSTTLNLILSLLGLTLIFGSMKILNASSPAYFKLLPCIGTFLVLAFSTSNLITSKILSAKALRGFGLISYSLYLWHMPIWAFARYSRGTLTTYEHCLLFAMCLTLSIIPYFAIENPARHANKKYNKKIMAALVSGSTLILTLSILNIKSNGQPQRLERPAYSSTH